MRRIIIALVFLSTLAAVTDARAARVKELTRVKGVRSNMLRGYGLVVGLAGTGDSRTSSFTSQALKALLQNEGVIVDERFRTRNVAAVFVTAELPAFSTQGDRLDVVVSTVGDAESLASGVLLMTPLKGVDNQVYALAQGPLVAGGFAFDQPLARRQRNNPTTARVPEGATVERGVTSRFVVDGQVTLSLVEADFATAQRIALAINEDLETELAKAEDSRRVVVKLPDDAKEATVAFLSRIEALEVKPDTRARVVINERSGTVVVGGNVELGPASVAHANLDVAITTALSVSQPSAFSRTGRTVVVPNQSVEAKEEQEELKAIPATTTVDDLVKALNALGASPRDLMQILEALERAGALRAEIEVM
ncbi:MAG: flagellar basal body P-ring protein FlgI [Deltaproteobacteria bacterium]|jgi:flagellar P-ring protein precursor FlgI